VSAPEHCWRERNAELALPVRCVLNCKLRRLLAIPSVQGYPQRRHRIYHIGCPFGGMSG
jgi:hypothetical protein